MYCAYVTTIEKIRKHNNADRLQCVTIFGNNVIVDLSYKKGQKVVYFPTDGQLGLDFAIDNNLIRKLDENGNNIGGYLDENKRNIGALKLRGEKSEGLLLPIECLSKYTDITKLKNGEQITVLNGVEICKKYIPQSNKKNNSLKSSTKKHRLKLRTSYPFFEEHIDTQQLDYNQSAFKEGDTIYITRKLHGCFDSNTKVRLWNKPRAVKITDIKVGDVVVGYKNGKYVPSVVQNTFNNGKSYDWQKIVYERKRNRGEKRGVINCTPDHLFWDYKLNDYKPAKELKPNEKIGLVKDDWIFDDKAKSIFLGLFLGDSYYEINESRHKGVGCSLQLSAKSDKIEYLEYIQKTLSDFLIIKDKHYTSGYGSDMRRAHTRASRDMKLFFDSILDITDSENKLTDKIIKYFDWNTLLFLYLDDGSLDHNSSQKDRASLAVCNYNEHDCKILIKCLNKLGLYNVTYYKDAGGYSRIRLNHNSAYIMFNKIKDYVPMVMKYKLPEEFRNETVKIPECLIEKGYNVIPCTILENVHYVSKKEKNKYDLQTETSNYVVGDLLVHNSSQRTGNTLEIITKKANPILKKVFRFKDKKNKIYSLITGTRRTIITDFDNNKDYYGDNAFRKKYHDFFKDKLPKGFEVFYEVVGWVNEKTPIMSKCSNSLVKDKEFSKKYGKETIFTYGCEQGTNDIYVYRMTMTNEDGVVIELPTEEVMLWCEKLGVKFVPVLDKFIYTTWEDLIERCNKFLDVPEPLANGSHIVEGVVVRIDNRDKFTAYKKKGFYFKVLEHIIKDTSDEPDMEEAEE